MCDGLEGFESAECACLGAVQRVAQEQQCADADLQYQVRRCQRAGGEEGGEGEEREGDQATSCQGDDGGQGDDTAGAGGIVDAELSDVFCGGHAEAEAGEHSKHANGAVDDRQFPEAHRAQDARGDDRSYEDGSLRDDRTGQGPKGAPSQTATQGIRWKESQSSVSGLPKVRHRHAAVSRKCDFILRSVRQPSCPAPRQAGRRCGRSVHSGPIRPRAAKRPVRGAWHTP